MWFSPYFLLSSWFDYNQNSHPWKKRMYIWLCYPPTSQYGVMGNNPLDWLYLDLGNQHTFVLFPSFFGTCTMLATHYGYLATTRKPASNYFLTSSLIFKDSSGFIHLNFCLTGGHFDFNGNLCSIILASRPGISWYDQEKNISIFL